ncbi:MAG: hypothetical protein Q9191_001891 [Dirinaria sp. TL-2023a]
MSRTTGETTLEVLSRLAAKPGVQSTLVLSKNDGSIIRSTGLLAQSTNAPSSPATESFGNVSATDGGPNGLGSDADKDAEKVARMVFSFMSSAQSFAEGMNASDEMRLLRLRTRRNEIVIVPDPKFLLVVIQDAPSAQ